ncbi:polysaccharide deacetylase family protein [Paenibacillus lycopersici]|uniref:Polysaccharide deacetylase family protein n=1 Tax=Paenibacillus lycopersici TaxID=2704462 RepID=A0A6C0FTM4_9BACL|nr:polysaccharide deacetylase family protein [Paenibacillus lycopersici]QHT60508.1 polysaccharide deacetylase family protein [Paenibacillus lycopersici]
MQLHKKVQASIAAIAALVTIAGCGADSNAASTDKPEAVRTNDGGSPQANIVGGAANGSDNASRTGHPSDAGTVSDSTAASEHASGSGASVADKDKSAAAPAAPSTAHPKKLYRMNAVYSFVPINKATASSNVVLLTFDDGPKAGKTVGSLLDTLDKHKAKAIFFVNGYRVKQHPELLAKIAGRGQTIGNHSWDHIDLKKESEAIVKKQIGDVQSIVKQVTGTTPVFFRPPFGSGGDRVKAIVRDNGMLYMTWSNGSLDWDSSTKNKPDKVVANVLDQLHPGVNILMHELPWTTEALDTLLTKLEAKGYGFIDPATIDLDPKPASANAK